MPPVLPVLFLFAVGVLVLRRKVNGTRPTGKLSRWFTWSEAFAGTADEGGEPSAADLDRIRWFGANVLDVIRDAVAGPVRVNSWWRSAVGNAGLSRSVADSLHMEGLAADIRADGMTASQLATLIRGLRLPSVDVVEYDTHVHVEYDD